MKNTGRFHRGPDVKQGTRFGEADMGAAMGIDLYSRVFIGKVGVVVAQIDGRQIIDHIRRPVQVEIQPARDTELLISDPLFERVAGTEYSDLLGTGFSHEILGEDVGRGLVETPIGYGDGGIDRLQGAFEVQHIGTMPRQKAGIAVHFARGDIGVHVAEIAVGALAPRIQGAQRRQIAIPLRRRQYVCAFLRIRTITAFDPSTLPVDLVGGLNHGVAERRTGLWNSPATKNGTG